MNGNGEYEGLNFWNLLSMSRPIKLIFAINTLTNANKKIFFTIMDSELSFKYIQVKFHQFDANFVTLLAWSPTEFYLTKLKLISFRSNRICYWVMYIEKYG